MSRKVTREISRFEGISNDSNRLFVIEFQGFIDNGAGNHPNETIPGFNFYVTMNRK